MNTNYLFKMSLLLLLIVTSLFNCVFAMQPESLQSDASVDSVYFNSLEDGVRFLDLYKEYLESFFGDVHLDFLERFKEYATIDVLDVIKDHVDVELSLEEIEVRYRDTGFIQLRPIDPGKRTLIIGCGNGPFNYCGGYNRLLVFDEEYNCQHRHSGAITISPELKCNPTILSYFGVRPLTIFEDGCFDKVLIEAISIPCLLDLEFFAADLSRILGADGNLYCDPNGLGPIKIDMEQLCKWGEGYDNDEDFSKKVLKISFSQLPMLFEKMIDENGQEAVEGLFCNFLTDYNWVHEDRSCNESFSIVNEKVTALKSSMECHPSEPAIFFTREESWLIRYAAFELGIYL